VRASLRPENSAEPTGRSDTGAEEEKEDRVTAAAAGFIDDVSNTEK